MEQAFDEYLGAERDAFVKAINGQGWSTQMRTCAEDILIAYDQMREKLKWIKIDAANIPNTQVIAIGYGQEILIGYISKDDEDFKCESENEILTYVTHWMKLPEPPNQRP